MSQLFTNVGITTIVVIMEIIAFLAFWLIFTLSRGEEDKATNVGLSFIAISVCNFILVVYFVLKTEVML